MDIISIKMIFENKELDHLRREYKERTSPGKYQYVDIGIGGRHITEAEKLSETLEVGRKPRVVTWVSCN